MNRTDRLLAIVLELQGRDRVTAEKLARHFEVTKRTIYRDIQALCESGVPVVSAAGQGYWLMDGYFLPPVSFSPAEAIMLILGSNLIAQSFDAQYQQASQSATRKIEAVLQKDTLAEVQYLKDNIRLINLDSQTDPRITDMLQQLRRSILERKSVLIHYSKKASRQKDAQSHRQIDPHSLLYFGDAWMLSAYCHLRKAMRMFRLSRIKKLEQSSTTFCRQDNFDIHSISPPEDLDTVVELLFDADIADWLRERPIHFVSSLEDSSAGLKVSLRVRKLEDCIGWVLSWGSKVTVLQPETMKQRLLEELAVTHRHHSS